LEIKIPIHDHEKQAVLDAIKQLNSIPHLRYMSQAMIANSAGIKATKTRAVLATLIEEGRITQYAATDNPKLQRFYYVINEAKEE
jgi:ribosomal protein S25